MTNRAAVEPTHVVRCALGLAALLVAACGGRDAGGDWTMRVDSVRAGAAGSQVSASLRADGKEGPEGEAPSHSVVLSLDCFGDNATVAIMTDQALRQGSTDLRMSVDSAPPRKLKGFAGTTSTGGKVLLSISQDSLLALLRGHRHATVRYADGAGSYKTTAEFPIAGLERHQAAFLAACGPRAGTGTAAPRQSPAGR
ncbi:MAG TPA: hypothetical protein VFJ81_01345 [Gemmatimonadales bacterium]|nr:hypothetical protein [Gemmatimonadales bacterium]